MRNPLLELSQNPGFEGLEDLAKTLERIGEKKKKFGGHVILPNLYLSTMDGYDIEKVLEALEGTLIESGLFHFNHAMRHYCLSLDYSAPADHPMTDTFPSFKTLYDAVEEELSRFGEPYEGILAIDITDWVAKGACSEAKFLDFLRYMADLDERTLAVYLERSGVPTKVETARKTIVAKTRLEKVELKLKSAQIGLQILENELSEFGFTLTNEAKEKMMETLEAALKVEGNEGPWTIRQLAEDMVYLAYKEGEELVRELGVDNITPFLPGGIWISDFAVKKRYYMGIVGD